MFGEELKLHLNAKTEVKLDADGNIEVHWEQDGEKGVFVAKYMLAAIGRRPNVDNIERRGRRANRRVYSSGL